MKIARVFTLVGAVMLVALMSRNGFAQSAGDPEVTPIDKGTMKPIKNSIENRLNRMAQQLALTAEQQAAIKPILEEETIKLKAIIADTTQDITDHKAKLQEMRQATINKIRPILTHEQQQRQEALRKDLTERRQKKNIQKPQ